MLRYKGALERRSKILDIIRSLDLPNNPLDDIIDQVLPYSLFGNPSLCVDSGCSVYLKKCEIWLNRIVQRLYLVTSPKTKKESRLSIHCNRVSASLTKSILPPVHPNRRPKKQSDLIRFTPQQAVPSCLYQNTFLFFPSIDTTIYMLVL